MEVGLSTASFYPDALTEEAVPLMGEMGVGIAEVFLESFSEYQLDFIRKVKDRLDKYNIRAYSVHVLSTQYEPQLFALTERQRRDAMKIFKKVLEGARMLGAQAYVFHGPPVRKNTQPSLDYSRIGQICNQLAEIAEDFNVRFTWENVFWCWFAFPEFASRLLEHVTSNNLYFTLDIKQAMKSNEDPFRFLSAMGSRIANVHVCDFNQKGQLLLPGRGDFDFVKLRDALGKVGYSGPIIMEVYRYNYKHYRDMLEGMDFLKKVFQVDKDTINQGGCV